MSHFEGHFEGAKTFRGQKVENKVENVVVCCCLLLGVLVCCCVLEGCGGLLVAVLCEQ